MGKPWELHKLGDFGEVLTCKRIFKDQTVEVGEIPFYKNGTIGLQADSFISRDLFTEFKALYPYPEVGDILISAVGSVGRTAEYKGEDAYFQDSNVVWLSTKGSIDKKYLKTYYEIIDWLIEGSTVKHLYNDNILNSSISVPTSRHEQEDVGVFFEKLNDLISLYEQKLDLLKLKKQSYLQKMFPKNGEDIPEFRFEGFTDPWEQRKFGDLYMRSSEKNDGSRGTSTNITVASMQYKPDISVSSPEYLKSYYNFNLGDIAFEGHHSKEFQFGRFVENDIGDGIVSHIFIVLRSIQEYDLIFWKYYINNESIMRPILAKCTKASTMMHDLVVNDFLRQSILVPNLEEQRQIGSLLKALDSHITLHQRKLDLLKTKKKAYLQNMFPENGEAEPKWRFEEFV